MKKKNISKTTIIAEMACAHDGNMNDAKQIIKNSYDAGADIIQFQIWKLDNMMDPKNKNYKKLKKIEFSKTNWINIVQFTRLNYPTLKIYVCVYEHVSIDFISKLKIDGIKINSSDLTNELVLKKVSKLNLPVNLSVGASKTNEIKYALSILHKIRNKITIMYGLQNFPTKINTVKLNNIELLIKKYKLPLGYQDHCYSGSDETFWLVSYALGIGCHVIEQHIHVKGKKNGFDHESALNKAQFKKFVKMIRTIDIAYGDKRIKKFNKTEIDYRNFQKKSIVASKNLKKNHIISENDILFLRKEILGLQPFEKNKILNKKLKNDIKKYQLINKKILH